MTTGPPPWAAWLLETLVPRRHHDILAGDVLDRYRDQILPAQGRTRANRWFLARVAEWAWTESRLACLIVVLSFLFGDGLYPGLPDSGATARAWLNATVPVCALVALGVRAGWRSGIRAAVITGFLASCLGTAAILMLTVVSLAIARPQLMKIGMSWESMRDVASILRTSTLAGTMASVVGGLVGTGLRAMKSSHMR
jgi:hypothetical protein